MKITTAPDRYETPFMNIGIGHPFRYINVIYMRIEYTANKNAVNLSTGETVAIDVSSKVIMIDAEITVKGRAGENIQICSCKAEVKCNCKL